MFKQAGNIQAQDEKDMVDLVKAFTLVSPPKGRRVGFVSASGGYAVLVSDACAREGLELPQFSAETLEELNQTLPPFWSHRNPIDMTASGFGMYGGGGIDIGVLAKGVELVLRDENIDAVICMAPTFDLMIDQLTQHFSSQEIKQKLPVDLVKPLFLQQQMELVKDIVRLKEKYNKPLVFTIMTPQAERSETLEFLMGNGIPTYETPYQAVRALSKLVDYREYLMRQG
jgi:acyl-CoA synthetase (NDP forming)